MISLRSAFLLFSVILSMWLYESDSPGTDYFRNAFGNSAGHRELNMLSG